MRSLFFLLSFPLFVMFVGCFEKKEKLPECGVSQTLARLRKETITDIRYNLRFVVPNKKESPVTGEVALSFSVHSPCEIVLDFTGAQESISSLTANGANTNFKLKNEHIILPSNAIRSGENKINISFTASDSPLNRRDDLLYTLLVPDRARTLFPCFDQPDLKARYTLQLELPSKWEAVANGAVVDSLYKDSTKVLSFGQTEPLSTYLFSFVAGKLDKTSRTRDNRTVSLFHRETDPEKKAQCDEILNQVFAALDWMEAYTGIPYPFAKYDLIILPGFQFGGMEHTGATLYSDRTMFLNANPTLNERLSRSKLIAHETSHMWFGDYVTMEWFSDVWTKEVFANYFASQIVAPMYKEVDHDLNFMMTYLPEAYSEDRTDGTNAIQQELDNLNNAGLVYGRIIYTKSPVVMDMLVRMIGQEAFRKGIREYLSIYGYGNASWEKLIHILDSLSPLDLKAWSDNWVNSKGRVVIATSSTDSTITVTQNDPYDRGIVWNEPLAFGSLKNGKLTTFDLLLDEAQTTIPTTEKPEILLPNTDGKGYGLFLLDQQTADTIFKLLPEITAPITRGSLLITLYENLMEGNISPKTYIDHLSRYLPTEENPLLFSMALNNLKNCTFYFGYDRMPALEQFLWELAFDKRFVTQQINLLRTYAETMKTEEGVARLYALWESANTPHSVRIGERDAMFFSYELAVRMPEQYTHITQKQYNRLSSDDRRKEYSFICPAVHPDSAIRDSAFNALTVAENRKVEPWAESALGYLNHPLYHKTSQKYIYPGLSLIQEIQHTGDIFFPKAWAGALLRGHHTPEARAILDRFLIDHPNLNPMLAGKIKQQAHHLRGCGGSPNTGQAGANPHE